MGKAACLVGTLVPRCPGGQVLKYPGAQVPRCSSGQVGFSMMELICVIMIIGSLAAVAFPQFMNVSKEARVARVQRLRADIQMVAASTRAECILINGCIGRRGTYTVLGKTIPLDYGYPRAGNSIGSDQIDALVDTNQFEVTLDNIDVTRFRLSTASNPATCYVLYREADGPSMKREYGLSINTTGC